MITRPCFKDLVLAQALGDFLEQNYYILSKYRVEQIGRNFEAFFNDVLTGNSTDENVIENQLSLMGWKISHRYGAAIIDVAGRDTINAHPNEGVVPQPSRPVNALS